MWANGVSFPLGPPSSFFPPYPRRMPSSLVLTPTLKFIFYFFSSVSAFCCYDLAGGAPGPHTEHASMTLSFVESGRELTLLERERSRSPAHRGTDLQEQKQETEACLTSDIKAESWVNTVKLNYGGLRRTKTTFKVSRNT